MSPDEFLAINEERQKLREINGEQPEYVNFNNAATKFLLDQVCKARLIHTSRVPVVIKRKTSGYG